ncbi:hypothetical protein L484_000127 [Morus notabilis]|uniref:Uncharacterized protein n=1 Tax=Morus notabilis TaxID=981085 RepID=W9SF81_9ROSA|nr:hypothetical protein L484_000127 [Morus notabilis]
MSSAPPHPRFQISSPLPVAIPFEISDLLASQPVAPPEDLSRHSHTLIAKEMQTQQQKTTRECHTGYQNQSITLPF